MRNTRKTPFLHMRGAKVKVSLCDHSLVKDSLCPPTESVKTAEYTCINENRIRSDCADASSSGPSLFSLRHVPFSHATHLLDLKYFGIS